jgi:hypothetical protein
MKCDERGVTYKIASITESGIEDDRPREVFERHNGSSHHVLTR